MKYIRSGTSDSILFTDRDMSTSFFSDWKDLENFHEARIQAVWTGLTGTINGKLFIETTTDPNAKSRIDESEALISSTPEEQSWEIEVRGKYYRIAYEANGITGGTMSATVTAKGD